MSKKFVITVCALAAFLLAVDARAFTPEPVLLLECPPGMTFTEWTANMASRGIHLNHAFPPVGGLLVLAPTQGLYATIADLPAGTLTFEESPSGKDADRLTATFEGRLLWHAQRALLGLEGPSAGEFQLPGRPLDHDVLEPLAYLGPEGACSAYSLYRTTSEYMLGTVSVSVILPESTGAASTEDWTPTLETNVSNGIVQGLNDLSNYYITLFSLPSSLKPTWTYHYYFGRTDARAQVTVEPISNPGPTASNPQWVNTIYDNLGYTSDSTMWDKGRHFNGDQRAGDGTDWAYTIFVANSLNDADGMFSDSSFAYAYLGGPFCVMTYDNDGWTISQMNAVARHESSHIFYALDEYSSSPCYCTQTSGYVNYQDQNCNKSCLINVPCIMNESYRQYNVCFYTAGQIGWGDSDADGVPDPVDIDPDTALTAYAPDPTTNTTLTYTGTATIQTNSNQNIYHYMCDMNILTIGNVQYRVDGGAWQNATASDGAFDSGTENYTFTATVTSGTHTFDTRAIDELGQTDASPATDTVTVTATCTDSYEPNDTCATAYLLSCGASINDAKLCSASDLDYFAVTPASTGTLAVSMTPPSGRDYDLILYSNDCGTTLCAPGVRGSGTETCNISVVGGTTYKVLVAGYGGAYDAATPYQLSLTCSCSAPVCASSPSPADTATGVFTSPTLSWSAVSGATSYDIYFGTAASPPFVTNSSTLSFAPGTLAINTTYKWKIVPKNACAPATGCTTWSFTTCALPACPAGPSPADAATGVSTSPTLTWSAVSGVASYDIYFGTASPPPLVSNVSAPSYAPGSLAVGTTYHWKVVSKSACGPATGCVEWSFTTCTLPVCPTGPSPPDAATDVSTSPTMTWSAVNGAASYDVYFGTASPPPLVSNVSVPSYTPGALAANTTYRWKVVSKSACGPATGCVEWSFTTCTLPVCPTGPSPPDAATGVFTTPTLTWGAVSGAASYELYFGTTSPAPFVANLSTPSYAPGTLSASTTYYWKIVPKSACGPAAGCTTWSFTTCALPSCPAGPAPPDAAMGVSTSATLTWSAVSGASSYDLYFGATSPPPLASNVSTPSYAPGTLSASTTYYWKIVPKSACGDAAGCVEWSFTTCAPPPCASAPSPADASTGVSTTPTLTWGPIGGASSYDVYFGTAPNPPLAVNMPTPGYTPAALANGTVYYWRVSPRNSCGTAPACQEWSFTTAVPPPNISLVAKAGTPFRIKVYGSNLQDGLRIYINGAPWGDTTNRTLVKWKNDGYIVIKKGASLKTLFPTYVFVPIRIVNPDGGSVTVEFDRKTKVWRVFP